VENRNLDILDVLDLLLGVLCRELGFCNRVTAAELLRPGTVLHDADFAHVVLRAENMNPEYEPKWVRQIRERFVTRFGRSISPSN